tara:strand:+ start:58 stop:882 length:825 start_codon:yes stop_codon:yes gene_type:complete
MLQNQEHNQPPYIDEEEQPLLYDRTPTPLCRICYESEGVLLQACNCAGTQGYVHRKCLRTWVTKYSAQQGLDAERCEICHAEWNIEMYSKWEKILKKWNWLFLMIGWYIVIIFTLVNFNWAACHPQEIGAYLVFFIFIIANAGLLKIHRGIYYTFRLTYTVLFLCGIITLTSSQEDYYDRKMQILDNHYLNEFQRHDYLEKLKITMVNDNPLGWPIENTSNKQMWLICGSDIILWIIYYIYCKMNSFNFVYQRSLSLHSDTSSDDDSSTTSDEV